MKLKARGRGKVTGKFKKLNSLMRPVNNNNSLYEPKQGTRQKRARLNWRAGGALAGSGVKEERAPSTTEPPGPQAEPLLRVD